LTASPGKLLVIRGGAIGDFVLTLPVLAALRRQLPTASLEVLGYPNIVELAVFGGLADGCRSIEARSLAGFFARKGELDPALAEYFSGFAVVISYLFDPDRIFEENVARCSKAQFIVGRYRPDEGDDLHATEVFLKPLERLAIFDADSFPRLAVAVREDDPLAGGQPLALHPGSGSRTKNWPEQRWLDFVAYLVKATDLPLLLVGGEAESDRFHHLAAQVPEDRLRLAWQLPLPLLARELVRCRGFVGHDSGITHLASALGIPSLVLWGPTKQAIWQPRGDGVQLVEHPQGIRYLAVDEVVRRLSAWLQ